MGDRHEARRPGKWRTKRLAVVDLEVAEVDRHSGALVDSCPRGAHGLDRLDEHRVGGRALLGQSDAAGFVGSRGQCRVAPGERDLTFRGAGPAAVLDVGNHHSALLNRRGDIEEQLAILLQDPPLQLLQFG